jgi:hypothetical protein
MTLRISETEYIGEGDEATLDAIIAALESLVESLPPEDPPD